MLSNLSSEARLRADYDVGGENLLPVAGRDAFHDIAAVTDEDVLAKDGLGAFANLTAVKVEPAPGAGSRCRVSRELCAVAEEERGRGHRETPAVQRGGRARRQFDPRPHRSGQLDEVKRPALTCDAYPDVDR